MNIETKKDDDGYVREYITMEKRDWYINFDFEVDSVQDIDTKVWKQLSTNKKFVEDSDDELNITLKEVFKIKVKSDYYI